MRTAASRSTAIAALALAAGALWLARGAGAHGSHGKVIRGAVVYQRLCASCHGASGRGDGPRAADGLAMPVDLTAIAARHGRFERTQVAAWIDGPDRAAAHGDAKTPVWGDPGLRVGTPEESGSEVIPRRLDELLDYLEHLQAHR